MKPCKLVVKLKEKCNPNVKMRHFIAFGFIFAVVYFLIVTSFFQGWQNAKFFDDIPDLFIFMAGLLFIFYSLKKCPKEICEFVFFGGLFIAFGRLLEIPLQEYQEMVGHIVSWKIWIPVVFLTFLGYLFLLLGFRRWKNGS